MLLTFILLTLFSNLPYSFSKIHNVPTLFDSSGRLYQVEYAVKASDFGHSVIAVRSEDYVLILSWSPLNDNVQHKSN